MACRSRSRQVVRRHGPRLLSREQPLAFRRHAMRIEECGVPRQPQPPFDALRQRSRVEQRILRQVEFLGRRVAFAFQPFDVGHVRLLARDLDPRGCGILRSHQQGDDRACDRRHRDDRQGEPEMTLQRIPIGQQHGRRQKGLRILLALLHAAARNRHRRIRHQWSLVHSISSSQLLSRTATSGDTNNGETATICWNSLRPGELPTTTMSLG